MSDKKLNCKNCEYKYCPFRGSDREISAFFCEDYEPKKEGRNMIPTREQLEEARHVLYHTYGHFTAFCNLNRSCEECDRIIRFGCAVKRKIEELQTKRILHICKSEPPKEKPE